MRVAAIVLAAVLLAAVVATASALLLQSCGLQLPFGLGTISTCKTGTASADLAQYQDQRRILDAGIADLEQKLAAVKCAPAPPLKQVTSPPLKKAVAPQPKAPTDGFDPKLFANRNIKVLQGCWQLDSNYSAHDIHTGKITHYNQWTICFDGHGHGNETLRSSNGATCGSAVTGGFDSSGKLVISDNGNVQCTDHSYIFRRVTTCSVDSAGHASCGSAQPSLHNGPAPVQLRRMGGTH